MKASFASVVFSAVSLAALFVGLGAVACGGKTDGGGSSSLPFPRSSPSAPSSCAGSETTGFFGGPCASASDCGGESPGYCAFDETQGCGAQGRCYTPCGAVPGGEGVLLACGCDSQDVYSPLLLPSGYASQPTRQVPDSTGACSIDSGGAPSSGGACCPPDPAPAACMYAGGSAQYGCVRLCDFFCATKWRIVDDPSGCPVWTYDTRAPAPGENEMCMPEDDAGEGDGDAG